MLISPDLTLNLRGRLIRRNDSVFFGNSHSTTWWIGRVSIDRTVTMLSWSRHAPEIFQATHVRWTICFGQMFHFSKVIEMQQS